MIIGNLKGRGRVYESPTRLQKAVRSDDMEQVKRPRGRPKKDIVKTVQVNIKMTKKQRRRFKMAAAYHDIDYSDLLDKALDALEFITEDEDDDE